MRLLVAALVLAGSMFTTQKANALEAPAWLCRMSFEGEARGLQVVVGKFQVAGTGDLYCVSAFGEQKHMPITVKMSALPVAARVAFGRFQVHGASAEVALLTNQPEDMLGTYLVAHAQGAIVAGAGVVTGVRVGLPEIAVNLQLQFLHGFGVNVGVTRMKIELDQSRL